MRFMTKIASFMLDTAVTLFGAACVGVGITMFSSDMRVAKKEKEARHENQD